MFFPLFSSQMGLHAFYSEQQEGYLFEGGVQGHELKCCDSPSELSKLIEPEWADYCAVNDAIPVTYIERWSLMKNAIVGHRRRHFAKVKEQGYSCPRGRGLYVCAYSSGDQVISMADDYRVSLSKAEIEEQMSKVFADTSCDIDLITIEGEVEGLQSLNQFLSRERAPYSIKWKLPVWTPSSTSCLKFSL